MRDWEEGTLAIVPGEKQSQPCIVAGFYVRTFGTFLNPHMCSRITKHLNRGRLCLPCRAHTLCAATNQLTAPHVFTGSYARRSLHGILISLSLR